jgi:nucleoside-diphosphate-sugar epimerase
MRLFVTGTTGLIGFAVARAYRRAGHEVLGLVRSEAGAERVAAEGIEPVRGTMQDPASFRAAAESCSLLIHAASDHDGDTFALDRRTVDALIEFSGRAPRPKTLLYTSGVWIYGDTRGRVVDESTPVDPPLRVAARPGIERAVLEAPGVRGIVVRPGCVYGGPFGLMAGWFANARAGRPPTVVGDGTNRWALVHRDDLAEGYLAIGERGIAGTILNLTDRSRATVGELAEQAARSVGYAGEPRLLPVDVAAETMGTLAECLAMDQLIDSRKAEQLLGWEPR